MKKIITRSSIKCFILLTLLLLGVFCSNKSYSLDDDNPEISTTIDFLDYVFYYNSSSPTYFPLQDWETCIAQMAASGINKIYLRANACGLTLYPTTVGTRYGQNGGWHWADPVEANKLINTLAVYDPVYETIRLGHQYGMEVWCWENLWDDAAMKYQPDPVQYASYVAQYGRFPLMDPFFRNHHEYYWQLDPNVPTQIETINHNANGTGISKIVFESGATANACDITASDISIYSSMDNITYTEYQGSFTFSTSRANGINFLTLDNLNLTGKYIKLVNEQNWTGTWTMILDATTGKCKAYDFNDNEVYTEWTWQDRVIPTTTPLSFSPYVPAAWDYGSRLVGFKTAPPVIGKIVFESGATSTSCRITASDISIYYSTDNVTFTKYQGSSTFSTSRVNGVNFLTIDNLNLPGKYVKLVKEQAWPDNSWTMLLDQLREKSKVYDVNGNEIYTLWTWQDLATPTTTPLEFTFQIPAAWDCYSRYVGFMTGDEEPEAYFYGVSELSIPAAKAYKLAKFEELVDNYDFDGYMFSLQTHSKLSLDANNYGFNQNIRDKYLQLYGKDIYTEDFDMDKWQDLKADSVDEFLYAAKQLTNGKPLYISGLKNRVPGESKKPQYEVFGDLPWHYQQWFQDESIDGVHMLGEYFPEYFTSEITGGKPIKLGMVRDLNPPATIDSFTTYMEQYAREMPVISKLVFESDATSSASRIGQNDFNIYTSNDNVTFSQYQDTSYTVSFTRVNGVNFLTIDNLHLTDKYVKLVPLSSYPSSGYTMVLDTAIRKSKAFDVNGKEICTRWTWGNVSNAVTDQLSFTQYIPAAWDCYHRYLGFKTEAKVVNKIVFESEETLGASRITASDFDIYTSDDNVSYSLYQDTGFTVAFTRVDGANILTIDNLYLTDKYIKLVSLMNYSSTGYTMVLEAACGKNKAYDVNGDEICTQWTWGSVSNPSTDTMSFNQYLPAAWDCYSRHLGFKTKTTIDEIELYETLIMSWNSNYYQIISNYMNQ